MDNIVPNVNKAQNHCLKKGTASKYQQSLTRVTLGKTTLVYLSTVNMCVCVCVSLKVGEMAVKNNFWF